MVADPASLSREFRALMTAIRVPLESELTDGDAPFTVRRERVKLVQRNVGRLFELVNSLFDKLFEVAQSEDRRRADSESMVLATTLVIPTLRDRGRSQQRDSRPSRAGSPSPNELDGGNHSLEGFSYSVSQDLRGPLRAVNELSHALLRDHAHALAPQGRELMALIESHVQRMTAVADALLAMSQVGRCELSVRDVDLAALARRVIADLRLREPARVVEVCVAESMTARCDPELVSIALENLLGNAWKFTAKRPGAGIVFRRDEGSAFAIQDNGIGFDMEHSERMFEPFVRLHGDEFEGTGIGLTLVRRAIERQGGQVWARGAVDRGATLRFTLGDPALRT